MGAKMKELIKGVESAVNMLDNVMNASGWTGWHPSPYR